MRSSKLTGDPAHRQKFPRSSHVPPVPLHSGEEQDEDEDENRRVAAPHVSPIPLSGAEKQDEDEKQRAAAPQMSPSEQKSMVKKPVSVKRPNLADIAKSKKRTHAQSPGEFIPADPSTFVWLTIACSASTSPSSKKPRTVKELIPQPASAEAPANLPATDNSGANLASASQKGTADDSEGSVQELKRLPPKPPSKTLPPKTDISTTKTFISGRGSPSRKPHQRTQSTDSSVSSDLAVEELSVPQTQTANRASTVKTQPTVQVPASSKHVDFVL